MCFSPRTLSDGQRVKCGCCYECRKEKARHVRQLLDTQLQDVNGVGVFMTFTYADESLDWVPVNFKLHETVRFPFRTSYHYRPDPTEAVQKRLIAHLDLYKFRQHFARQLNLGYVPDAEHIEEVFFEKWTSGAPWQKKVCERFRYLFPSYNDGALVPTFPHHFGKNGAVDDSLQRFMKRLRNRCPNKIWFYAVQEYGPLTYRPHWHIVAGVYGYSKEQNESFWKTVAKPLWESMYGHCDYAETVREVHSTASYVSKYISKPQSQENPYCECGLIARPDMMRHHSAKLGVSLRIALANKFEQILNKYEDVLPTTPENFVPSQPRVEEDFPTWTEVKPKDFPSFYSFAGNATVEHYQSIPDYIEECEAAYYLLDRSRKGKFYEALYNALHYWLQPKFTDPATGKAVSLPMKECAYSAVFQGFWPKRDKRYRIEELPNIVTEDDIQRFMSGDGELHEISPNELKEKRIYAEDEDSEDDLPSTPFLDQLVYPHVSSIKDTGFAVWQSYKSYCELYSIVGMAEELRYYISEVFQDECPNMAFEDFMEQFRMWRYKKTISRRVSSEHADQQAREQSLLRQYNLSDVIC